jgi:hypothetical protein
MRLNLMVIAGLLFDGGETNGGGIGITGNLRSNDERSPGNHTVHRFHVRLSAAP